MECRAWWMGFWWPIHQHTCHQHMICSLDIQIVTNPKRHASHLFFTSFVTTVCPGSMPVYARTDPWLEPLWAVKPHGGMSGRAPGAREGGHKFDSWVLQNNFKKSPFHCIQNAYTGAGPAHLGWSSGPCTPPPAPSPCLEDKRDDYSSLPTHTRWAGLQEKGTIMRSTPGVEDKWQRLLHSEYCANIIIYEREMLVLRQ